MRQKYLRLAIGLLLLLVLSLVIMLPATQALAQLAHTLVPVVTPTPTADASTALQMAQQEETNIQTILSIMSILVVAFPLLFAAVGVALGVYGFRSIRDISKQGQKLLKEMQKLHQEAEEKKEAIGQMHNALATDIKAAEGMKETIEQMQAVLTRDIQEVGEKNKEMKRTQMASLNLVLGDRFAAQKETSKAIEAYKKAGSLLQDDPQIHYMLGRIYSSFGYFDDAIASLESATKEETDVPEAEMELGLAYRRRGEYQKGPDAQTLRERDYDKAIEHLQKATQLRTSYEDALGALGGLYRRLKEYGKALACYEQAFEADPRSSYALSNAANLAWYLGLEEKARMYFGLTELVAAARAKADHSQVYEAYWDYYDLALAQLVQGKMQEATHNYQKAIADTPGVVQFDSVLNVLYFLKDAPNPIVGLDEVIHLIETERAKKYYT